MTYALDTNITLVTDNINDFNRIEGLRYITWAKSEDLR